MDRGSRLRTQDPAVGRNWAEEARRIWQGQQTTGRAAGSSSRRPGRRSWPALRWPRARPAREPAEPLGGGHRHGKVTPSALVQRHDPASGQLRERGDESTLPVRLQELAPPCSSSIGVARSVPRTVRRWDRESRRWLHPPDAAPQAAGAAMVYLSDLTVAGSVRSPPAVGILDLDLHEHVQPARIDDARAPASCRSEGGSAGSR